MKFDKLQIYNKDYFDIRLGLVDLYIDEETNALYAQKLIKYSNETNYDQDQSFFQQRLESQQIPIQAINKCQGDKNLLQIKILFEYPQNDLFDFYEDLQDAEKLEIFLIQALQAINFLQQNGKTHGNIRHEFFQYQQKNEKFQLIDNFDNQRYDKKKAQENFEDLIFLSPQYFKDITNNNEFQGSLVKEDIFCLGLIALYLLQDIDEIISIYDFDNKKFDIQQFQKLKKQINFQDSHSYLEILIKDYLLCENEDDRASPQEAFDFLMKKNKRQKSIANYSFDYSKNWVQELQGSDTTYVKKSLRSIHNPQKFSFNKDKDFDSIQKIDSQNVEQQYQSHKHIDDQKKKELTQYQSNLRSMDNIQDTEKKSSYKGTEIIYKQIGELTEHNLKPDSRKFDRYSFGYFSQNLSENKQSKASDLLISKVEEQKQNGSEKKIAQNNSSKEKNEEQIFRSTIQEKPKSLEKSKNQDNSQNFQFDQDNDLLSIDSSNNSEEQSLFDQKKQRSLLENNSMLEKSKNSQINKSNVDEVLSPNIKSESKDIDQSQNKDVQADFYNYGLLSENSSEKGNSKSLENTSNQQFNKKNLLTNEFENMDLLSMDNTEYNEQQQSRFKEQEVKSFQQFQQIKKAPLMETQFYEDDTIKQSKLKPTLGFGRNKHSKGGQFFDHQIETGGESCLDGSMSIIVNKNLSKMGFGLNKDSEQKFQNLNIIISKDNTNSYVINDSVRENLYTPTNCSIKEEDDTESQIEVPQDFTSNNNSSLQQQQKNSQPERHIKQQFNIQIPKKRMSDYTQMVQKIHIFQRPSRKSAMNNLLQKEVNSLKSSFSNLELDDIGNTLISNKKDQEYQNIQKDIDQYVRNYFTDQRQVSKIDSKFIQNKIFDELIEKKKFKNRRSSKQLQQIKWMVNSRVNVELVQKKKNLLQDSSQVIRQRIATIKEESLDINISEVRPQTNRFRFVEQIDKEEQSQESNKFNILQYNKNQDTKKSLVQQIYEYIQSKLQNYCNDEQSILEYLQQIFKQNQSYQYISKKYIQLKQKFFTLNQKSNESIDNINFNLKKLFSFNQNLKKIKDELVSIQEQYQNQKMKQEQQKISIQLYKKSKINMSKNLQIINYFNTYKNYQKQRKIVLESFEIFQQNKKQPIRKIDHKFIFKSQNINFCNYHLQESEFSQYSDTIDVVRNYILQEKKKKNYQTFSSQIITVKSSQNNSLHQFGSDYNNFNNVNQTIYEKREFSPFSSTIKIQTQSYIPCQIQNYTQNKFEPLNYSQQSGHQLNFRRIQRQQHNINQQGNVLPIKKKKLKVSGFEKRSTSRNNFTKFQFNQCKSFKLLQNVITFEQKILKQIKFKLVKKIYQNKNNSKYFNYDERRTN